MKVKFHSPDRDTNFFDIVAGLLQGDTLVPYLFIICLDYVLWMLINLIRENGFTLKKVRSKFIYLSSIIFSTESDINMHLPKMWIAIDKQSIIWKSDLSNKIKWNFFQAAVVSILLYGCTIWTLIKCIEKKLEENCTRMLWAILEATSTKQQLFSHLSPISKIIQIRHTEHCWRSKDELISGGCANVGQPTKTYLQQLCTDTGCNLEDLMRAIGDRDKWQERVREIHASNMTWKLHIPTNSEWN